MNEAGASTVVGQVWLTVEGVASHVQCGPKVVYRAVKNGKLRAARIDGRGDLRFKLEWVDAWVESLAPVELPRVGGKSV
jgi:excisionase family DNA binding protein